jgi:hypothetical protein
LSVSAAYRQGIINIERAQSSIELNSDALEGDVPKPVHDAAHRAGSELEVLRFTETEESAREQALAVLSQMESVIRAHYPEL